MLTLSTSTALITTAMFNRDLSSNNNDSVVSNAGNMSAFTIRLVNHGNVFAYVSGNNVVWGSVAHVWNELA